MVSVRMQKMVLTDLRYLIVNIIFVERRSKSRYNAIRWADKRFDELLDLLIDFEKLAEVADGALSSSIVW